MNPSACLPSRQRCLSLVRWTAASLPLLAGIGMHAASFADEPACRFFADGTLVGLRVGGEEVLRGGRDRDGFFTLLFDGLQVRRAPLANVVAEDGTIRVTGPNGLPRLTFRAEADGRRLTLRLVRAEGIPRGRDASILFKAATHRPVFARVTDPRVAVETGAESIAVFWTRLGDDSPVSGDPGVVLDLDGPSTPPDAPPPRPASAGPVPPLPFKTINSRGDGRFMLLRFDGRGIEPVSLRVLGWDGTSLVVGRPDAERPRFTFRVVENDQYLVLALVGAAGDFSARDASLVFESHEDAPREVFRLDYMGRNDSGRERIRLVWPHLWNPDRSDPLGAFGILHPTAGDADRDRALAALWAEGTLPHPAIGRPWTAAEALGWVDAYHRKFSGLSTNILSAADRVELDALTDWTDRVGVRRVYLHTDTWRAEYWPRERSLVDVNPAVFPGGRADLVAYGRQLHDRGMQLELHNVSGGIGRRDPEFVRGGRVDPRLATWVRGRLAKPVDDEASELAFRPESDSSIPHLRLEPRVWDLRSFRIGAEIVTVGEIADVDRSVWTLRRVTRGSDGTPRSAHAGDAEMAGLMSAYGQNYVPDTSSDLLAEVADRYARLVNEAQLDHQHYDGAEIHRHLEPWGFDKFSWLVAGRLDRATTSSTSGGVPSPWNIELAFSRIRGLQELGYWPLAVPVLLDGHRPATAWLDAHYQMASAWLKSGRRLGFMKPEPMFGLTEDIRARHGLMPRYEALIATWRRAMPACGPAETAYLRTLLSPMKSHLAQAGQHEQACDVPVLESTTDGFALVPTRVLVRDGLDGPWIVGQEFGPHGPRQYLRPGEPVELRNPHPPQAPEIVLRVLPALVTAQGSPTGAAPGRDARLAGDRSDADATRKAPLPDPPPAGAGPLWPAPQHVRPRGATSLAWQEGAILLTSTNATAVDLWEEEALPTWGCRVPLGGRRGLLLDVEGDGSGAVLVVQLHGAGTRDYVVKLDFTGPRRIVIPNGEVAWSAASWGWRMGAKHFDYDGEVRAVSLGFGHLPAKASARVLVRRLELLDNAPGVLRDPVVHVGDGRVGVGGEVRAHEYLVIDAAQGARVFDRNWNFLRRLDSQPERFTVPEGPVTVRIDAAADGGEPPWLELQVITRGRPHVIQESSADHAGATR